MSPDGYKRIVARARAAWTADRQRLASQLAAMALVQVGVSALLRLLWLARPDPFGNPLVGKVDWYWFHAIALDAWQAFRVVLAVALVGMTLGRGRHGPVLTRALVLTSLVALTVLAVLDAEVMRFIGMHISPTLVRTYANAAALRELPALLADDAGLAYLGVALLLTAPVAVALLARRASASAETGRPALGFAALVAVGYLYAFILWPGGFRQWRLLPPLDVARRVLDEPEQSQLTAAELAAASRAHADRYRAGASDAVFPLPDYPLFHVSEHLACRSGHLAGARCTRDEDGDGAPLLSDCDDRDPSVHPGASDLPTDGVDQNCDGVDLRPPNVLLLILETHRALDVGHLLAPAGRPSATPQLDALAEQGVSFTRAVANGTPTVNAFMALHTSLYPHPSKTVAASFTHVRMRALPEILREHGYFTRFFSAADPAWDNQTAWLRRWYEEVDYDRSREQDGPLFAHMTEWFERSWNPQRGQRRPFFVAAMTRTNHYPFHRIEGVPNSGGDSLLDRIADTMRYTDEHMGRLLERLAQQPWWKDTVVIVTGDHGFPLGEHGYGRLHETAHVEATGVPIVIAGGHPEVAAWLGKRPDTAASHVDIAPTVLDLAGIDDSGAFVGRSLLRALPPREAVTITAQEWALSKGPLRALVRHESADAAPGPARFYDRLQDPRERRALAADALPREAKGLEAELLRIADWTAHLYEHDRLWPETMGLAAPAQAGARRDLERPASSGVASRP